MTRAAYSALLLALLAVGCSSSDGVATGAPDTTTTTVATTTTELREVTASAAVEYLKASGLPIGEVVVYDETTDPNSQLGRPGRYVGKAAWHDTRVERIEGIDVDIDAGGTVEVFTDPDALRRRREYLESLGEASEMFGQHYVYERGPVLLRVTFDLTPSQAAEYEQALGSLPV